MRCLVLSCKVFRLQVTSDHTTLPTTHTNFVFITSSSHCLKWTGLSSCTAYERSFTSSDLAASIEEVQVSQDYLHTTNNSSGTCCVSLREPFVTMNKPISPIERQPLPAPTAGDGSKPVIVTDGPVRIEAYDQGSGPVIVILPSLGRSADDYDTVADFLIEDGWRVVRPQPRGIGNSTGPLVDLTLHDFAADVAMVMDQLKTGAAFIVGHAWGSQPARMLAVDRPDLVRGVVMAAASAGKLPPGSDEKPYRRNREAIDGSGNMELSEEQRLTYLRQAFFAPGNDPRAWLGGWYAATHKAQAHARDFTPIDEYFSAGDVVPLHDLQAQHDAVVVKNVFKPALGARVEVQTIPDCGHAMAPEQPKAMADAIGRFSRQHCRA